MFRVIIAGSRDFNDYALLQDHADYMLSRQEDIDKLKIFPADWDKYGRRAGPIRNREMAEYADALLAYWDGKSRGTKNMIEEARARGLKVSIKIFE